MSSDGLNPTLAEEWEERQNPLQEKARDILGMNTETRQAKPEQPSWEELMEKGKRAVLAEAAVQKDQVETGLWGEEAGVAMRPLFTSPK